MPKVTRPVQGNNSSAPFRRPKPSYKGDSAPKVVSRGTVSAPVPLPKFRPGTLAQDAVPTVITL